MRTILITGVLVCLLPLHRRVAMADDKHEAQSDAAFLRLYLKRARGRLSKEDLQKIKRIPKEELLSLDVWTTNKLRWPKRDAKLVKFFRDRGFNDPGDMSDALLKALWEELDSEVLTADRAAIEENRRTIRTKRMTYEKLSYECRDQLTKHKAEFDLCYSRFGPPLGRRSLFRRVIVTKDGRTGTIDFFSDGDPKVQACVRNLVETFSFSRFELAEALTLELTEFPLCRVEEASSLFE